MKQAFILYVFLLFSGTCYAQNPAVFSTWEGFEVDKLACIWLIERFIAPDAQIILYPRDKVPEKGIQFDTPFSKIRRRYNQSAFDALLVHYGISDPRLSNIAALIHDIEINIWEKKRFQKTREVEIFFMILVQDNPEHTDLVQKALTYLDQLYDTMPLKLEKNISP